tara:strand:- start:309 stop:896 length:588 start_codon:yes stop_codon:yes gene_type:complete
MKNSLKLINGRKIESPKSDKTRPTTLMVREAVFNILGESVKNSDWLDLFCGSGSLSCEAYNHGAKRVVAVEKNRQNAQLSRKNLISISDSQIRKNNFEIICKDVFSWIKSYSKGNNVSENNLNKTPFDFIYIDPPYKCNFYEILLKNLFNSYAIKDNTLIICEHSKKDEIIDNPIWKKNDIRIYGQTQLTFLIKI